MDIIPIIELYEYQIHKYEPQDIHLGSPKYKELYKFNDIDDSPDTECKRISVDGLQHNTDNDTNKTTCDPIYNIGGMLKHKLIYDINNIYGNYKLFLAKDTHTEQLDDESINIIIDNINKSINIQMDNINKSNFDKTKILNELNNSKLNNSKLDNKKIQSFQNETAIIQNLYVNNNKKIILLGDLHGSFHTFFRILCRLHRYNVIDLETFKINDDYIIIFLGDILDRGMYALDILNIIFKLINNNNTDPQNPKIIYNRGNHENYDQYHQNYMPLHDRDLHITANEIYNKFNNEQKFNEFINNFNFLLCILPSAIIINNTDINKRFWCCHGGFPKAYINKNMNLNLTFNLIDSHNDSTDIRWSDFGSNTINNYADSVRGANIVTYSYNGTFNFLNHNNIDFIIRGHQDSYNNSVLFNKNGDLNRINDPNNFNIEDILYYNESSKEFRNRVNGPIARLIADKKKYKDIFPVLTISTNTDNRRFLNSDSFALLKFNNNILDFTRNTLSIINSIRDVLKNPNINKGDILENKLKILKQIYEKYNTDVSKINLTDINNIDNIDNNINSDLINIYNDLNISLDYYINKINHMNDKINDKINIDIHVYIEKMLEEIKYILKLKNDYDEKIKKKSYIKISDTDYKNISSEIHNLINIFLN
jgi:hypothetical protein